MPIFLAQYSPWFRFVGRQCGSWAEFQAGECCNNPTAVMGEWLEPR